MMLKPLEVRKAQRLFSIIILLGIISAAAPGVVTKVEFQAPTPTVTSATKLMILHEGYNIELGKPTELTVRAVNEEGLVDTSRDDLVQLNITSLSYMSTHSELSATTLRLQNGSATAFVIGRATEMVRITAEWKEGRSELKSALVVLSVGVGGE
ncbi:hypothetical protein KEJ39_05700 [Candidatus Bathyarchaeota archaeon]|nr:hypothetical protein [Candidatus Bathyarchaeota archaeon]